MLEWIKKVGANPDDPMRSPSAASTLLANLRGADPVTALNELSGWLESLEYAEDFDQTVRSEVLGLIQEAGAAHVSTLSAVTRALHLAALGEIERSRRSRRKLLGGKSPREEQAARPHGD